MSTHGAAFFAALNTHKGFISYFREIFDKIDTVYIIKGGSGTGKSRFMREISEAAKLRGYSVEEFLCSSDPTSLDGIIIDELSLAVLDGTAPHVHEPTLVGARERFVDLSVFLDSSNLKARKSEIERLVSKKSERYAEIYEYMKVIYIYNSIINKYIKTAFDEEKMDKAVQKSGLMPKKGERYTKNVRIRSANSTDGIIVLNSFAKMAKNRIALSNFYGLGGIYLKKLLNLTDKKGFSVTVSYDPFNPELPDALYYPDSDTSFYIGSEGDFDEYLINVRRFIDDETLRPYKAEIRGLNRLKKEAINTMEYSFAQAKQIHRSVEDIYCAAMDFRGKEKLTKEYVDLIFNRKKSESI